MKPYMPIRADHRYVHGLMTAHFSGRSVAASKEYTAVCDRFVSSGGSWAGIFLGNIDDVEILKGVVRAALKDGTLTSSKGW